MAKTTANPGYCPRIGAALLIFAATILLSGCKEATSQQSPNGVSESNDVQTQSKTPAKAENPTPAENAQSNTVVPAQEGKHSQVVP